MASRCSFQWGRNRLPELVTLRSGNDFSLRVAIAVCEMARRSLSSVSTCGNWCITTRLTVILRMWSIDVSPKSHWQGQSPVSRHARCQTLIVCFLAYSASEASSSSRPLSGRNLLVGWRHPQSSWCAQRDNVQCTIQHSSLMLSWPVWLRIFGHRLVGRRWKVGWSTWTMRVLTIRGELKDVSRPQEPNTWRIRFAAQVWPRMTCSSLDMSKGNYLIPIVRIKSTSWTRSLKFSLESANKRCWVSSNPG
jgi:hypothetical protein